MTDTTRPLSPAVTIGILGTGNIARALGTPWAAHSHRVVFGGRSIEKARALAAEVGLGATSASLSDAARGADVVLLAIPWAGIDDVLEEVGAGAGGLGAVTVIDPTNPVVHGGGQHLLEVGSAAEHIASRAPGARVVKAFNVHPAGQWEDASPGDVVAIAGDHFAALEEAGRLVHEIGATPHVLGGLDRARQIEELAATVISLQFGGVDPRFAVPRAAVGLA